MEAIRYGGFLRWKHLDLKLVPYVRTWLSESKSQAKTQPGVLRHSEKINVRSKQGLPFCVASTCDGFSFGGFSGPPRGSGPSQPGEELERREGMARPPTQ